MSIAELERPSPPSSHRPCDDPRFRPPRREAPSIDVHASATAWLLGEALQALEHDARRRILGRRHGDDHDSSHPLVADDGCDVRIGGAAAAGSLRLALLAWLPLSRAELGFLEHGLFQATPAGALALLLRPPTIWSLGEAVSAARGHPGGPHFEPERFEALERYGRERVGGSQLQRVRAGVTRIESRLPVRGFPLASATVADGCRAIAADDAWCAVTAARVLARYATSGSVRRLLL